MDSGIIKLQWDPPLDSSVNCAIMSRTCMEMGTNAHGRQSSLFTACVCFLVKDSIPGISTKYFPVLFVSHVMVPLLMWMQVTF